MKIQTITINGSTFEISDPAVSILEQTAEQLQQQITENGQSITALQEDQEQKVSQIYQTIAGTDSCVEEVEWALEKLRADCVLKTAQTLTDGQKAQVLENIGISKSYVKLCETVTVTDDDVAAAGDEGITCITVGSDELDLTPYNNILIKLYVPKDEELNSGKGMLRIYATPTEEYSGVSANELLFTQSLNISTMCGVNYDNNNVFAVKAQFAGDAFLYGQVMKNGWGTSNGYSGVQNAWAAISAAMKKSEKHFFHITAYISAALGSFKFPAGSYVEIYGR